MTPRLDRACFHGALAILAFYVGVWLWLEPWK